METADSQEQEPVQEPKLSNRSPMFVVEPPVNLATASQEEIRAWSRQLIESFREQIGWEKKPD